MKPKYIKYCFFGLISILIILLTLVYNINNDQNIIRFATSADYPPFEYTEQGELAGFDIELAYKIAEQVNKTAEFYDMQFSAVLPSLQADRVDAAISAITITNERSKKFAFSAPYYVDDVAILFIKKAPITNVSQLAGKKIASQLGTTMAIWLKKHATKSEIIVLDTNPQAIEALKAGHVDGVMIDAVQAAAFSVKNLELSYQVIAKSDNGYAIAFKKGSQLKNEVNKALASLKQQGFIDELAKKYLEH